MLLTIKTWGRSTFLQDSAFLRGEAVGTGKEAGAAHGRKKHGIFPVGSFSGGMNPCAEPATLLLGRVCTHQEARRIIQEAAKAAHKPSLQEGRVFWGQLLWLVDGSRKAKTLPCCGREGRREDQSRIHPSWAGGPHHWALQQFAEHSNRNWGKATTLG